MPAVWSHFNLTFRNEHTEPQNGVFKETCVMFPVCLMKDFHLAVTAQDTDLCLLSTAP